MASEGQYKGKFITCGSDGSRTHNLSIDSRTLYQLSYTSFFRSPATAVLLRSYQSPRRHSRKRYSWWDSNPHALRQMLLKHSRIPIPPQLLFPLKPVFYSTTDGYQLQHNCFKITKKELLISYSSVPKGTKPTADEDGLGTFRFPFGWCFLA